MREMRGSFSGPRLFWRRRTDGYLIRHRNPLQTMMLHLMPSRGESCIYFRQQIDLAASHAYISQNNQNRENEKLSVFILFLTAIVRTLALKPRLNRFVAGGRLFARNRIHISYVVKREMSEQGAEVAVKQTFAADATILDVARQVNTTVAKARAATDVASLSLAGNLAHLPGFMLRPIIGIAKALNNAGLLPAALIAADPLFASVFISNVGSIGIAAPFHHLYEWGTVSVFVVIGKYRQEEQTGEEGRYVVDVTFTVDERIADGYYFAQAVKLFRSLIEHPEQMAGPPAQIVLDS